MSLEYGVEEITMVLRERLFLAGFERALEREKESRRNLEFFVVVVARSQVEAR